MNPIKFATSDPSQLQFAAAVRKNVSEYFKSTGISPKANMEMYVKSFVLLSLYFVPFILLVTIPMPIYVAIALVIIMGIGTAGVGMSVMHDAAHGSYSNKNWVNNLMAGSMYVLGGNVFNWKIQHNVLHHTYTNISEYDQDIASRGPLRLSDHAPVRKIHRYQYLHAFFFYGLMTLLKVIRDFTQLAEYNAAGYTKQNQKSPTLEYIKMIIVKVIYFALIIGLPILLTDYLWWQVVLGFIIMHWVTGFVLGTIFQMAHVVEGVIQPLPNEAGMIDKDWAVHELETTANFARNNRFLNWYIGGLNFQIEHHLFPHICHVHYPKISPIVEQTAKEFGLPYHLKPTFREALASHVNRLKELGRPTPASQPAVLPLP